MASSSLHPQSPQLILSLPTLSQNVSPPQEKILEIKNEDSTSQSISRQDSLAKVLGKEHSVLVRALGFESCPYEVFGSTTSRFSGMMLSSPSLQNTVDPQLQQRVHQLEPSLETMTLKRHAFEGALAYIFQKLDGNVPVEFANLFTMAVQDEGSQQTSLATARPLSSSQNNNEDFHQLHIL